MSAETKGLVGGGCLDYIALLEDLLDARTVESAYTADYTRTDVNVQSTQEERMSSAPNGGGRHHRPPRTPARASDGGSGTAGGCCSRSSGAAASAAPGSSTSGCAPGDRAGGSPASATWLLGWAASRRRRVDEQSTSSDWAMGVIMAIWVGSILHACLINSSWLQWRARHVPWYAQPTAPPPTWPGGAYPPAPAVPSPYLPTSAPPPSRTWCRAPTPITVPGRRGARAPAARAPAAGGPQLPGPESPPRVRGRQRGHGRAARPAAGFRRGARAAGARRTGGTPRVWQRG